MVDPRQMKTIEVNGWLANYTSPSLDLRLLERYGKQRRMMWPRFRARRIAKTQGWFWLPCPVCGRPFAGFEAATGGCAVMTVEGLKVPCSRPECVERGEREYKQLGLDDFESLADFQSQLEYRAARRHDAA